MLNTTETNPTAANTATADDAPEAIQPAGRMNISGDEVNRSTADLPDEQRSLIRWLHAHSIENQLSLTALAAAVGLDTSTISRVFHGKYSAGLEGVCQEVARFKKLFEARQLGRKLAFIETELSRRIAKLCDSTLEFQKISFIFGASQTGKTTALKHYQAEHNHGTTIYCRMPTGGVHTHFLEEMAMALRISPKDCERNLRRRIINCFDDRMLLIVDEAHQCVVGHGSAPRRLKALEFIRELYDTSGCGVIICGTPILASEIESGINRGLLQQFVRRRWASLRLPDRPSENDLRAFSAAYHLPAAEGEYAELQRDVVRDEALGMWLTLLRMASKMANGKKQAVTWEIVKRAWVALKRLEGSDSQRKNEQLN